MNFFTLKNVIIFLLMASITGIFIFLYINLNKSFDSDNNTILNPTGNFIKADCNAVRTNCDLSDPSSCNSKCSEVMKCINLNALNGQATDINKGGSGIGVCVLNKPDIKCNVNNGGYLVWTGFGFTNQQEWSCLCNNASYYSGPSCENLNPAFCVNGSINTDVNITDVTNSCVCDNPDYPNRMQWADSNIPFCANKDKTDIKKWPNWENAYINTNTSNNTSQWAEDIANEMYDRKNADGNIAAIKSILLTFNPIPSMLTPDIINALCAPNVLPSPGASGICSQPLPTGFEPSVSYTYYQDAEFI